GGRRSWEAAGGLAFGMLRAPYGGPGLTQILQMAGEPLDLQTDLRPASEGNGDDGAIEAKGQEREDTALGGGPHAPMLDAQHLVEDQGRMHPLEGGSVLIGETGILAASRLRPPSGGRAGIPDAFLRRSFPAEAVQHEREALLPREIFHI